MSYTPDTRSRRRGILGYGLLIVVSVTLGLLIRTGVITNQPPW